MSRWPMGGFWCSLALILGLYAGIAIGIQIFVWLTQG
jgi:hypothetical protein